MNLEVNSIKSILNLYDELLSNGITLVYLGEFTHEITKMFTSMSEHEMDRKSEERTVKRRVYHSMVEILQNMNKHSDEIAETSNIGKGLFLIGQQEDKYFIITANKVNKSKIPVLKSAINEVNEASADELKQMYKTQLRDGKITNKGGAGLGLIDIARKTQEKIQYQFIPMDNDSIFFILKVEISLKSTKTKKDSAAK